jgi:hypothetical protein
MKDPTLMGATELVELLSLVHYLTCLRVCFDPLQFLKNCFLR